MWKSYRKSLCFMAGATALALCFFASDGWCAAPAAPVIRASASGFDVTVSWNSVTEATGYALFYAPYPSATPIRNTDMGSRTSFSATLRQGTGYYVAVKAANATGSSGYSNIFIITAGASEAVASGTATDISGNLYHTVTIGAQVWMKENLKVTKYRNGDGIGTTSPAVLNTRTETSPKYQWPPDGDENKAAVYGRLYTWHAATDSRGVCPTGWHVPTDAEWTTLQNYLGGISLAGGKMKETGTSHWISSNSSVDNSSGFTALPGGYRDTIGSFTGIGATGVWLSATEYDTANAWYCQLRYSSSGAYRGYDNKSYGFSIRCVGD